MVLKIVFVFVYVMVRACALGYTTSNGTHNRNLRSHLYHACQGAHLGSRRRAGAGRHSLKLALPDALSDGASEVCERARLGVELAGLRHAS